MQLVRQVAPSAGRWPDTCENMMVWKMKEDRQVVLIPDS